MGVVAGDGGVDLHRHAERFQVAEAGDGRVEGSGMPRNVSWVMASEPSRLMKRAARRYRDHARDMLGDQRAVGGESDAQAFVSAVARQLKNVRAEQWFAAAQHENGIRNFGNLIDDVARGLRGKIGGRT